MIPFIGPITPHDHPTAHYALRQNSIYITAISARSTFISAWLFPSAAEFHFGDLILQRSFKAKLPQTFMKQIFENFFLILSYTCSFWRIFYAFSERMCKKRIFGFGLVFYWGSSKWKWYISCVFTSHKKAELFFHGEIDCPCNITKWFILE